MPRKHFGFGAEDAFSRLDQCQHEGNDKMKLTSNLTRLGAMILLLASVSLAQQVKTDYDRSGNFVQYRTYSWEYVSTGMVWKE